MVTFASLWRRFLAIFKSKIRNQLDELETIRDQARNILEAYKQQKDSLTKAEEEIQATIYRYKAELKPLQEDLVKIETAYENAVNQGVTGHEMAIVEAQLDSLTDRFAQKTDALAQQEAILDEVQADYRQAELDEMYAQNTLQLAVDRYEQAKDLYNSNKNANLSDSLVAQIKAVQEQSANMQARYQGLRAVQKNRKKSSPDAVIKKYTAPTSSADRLAAIKARQASATTA